MLRKVKLFKESAGSLQAVNRLILLFEYKYCELRSEIAMPSFPRKWESS